MAIIQPSETKIEQKTAGLLFIVATFPISFAAITYIMLTSKWAKSGSLLPYAFIAFEACFLGGLGIYYYFLSKYPGYVVVRKDDFSIRPAGKKVEMTYAYSDILYFESRLTKGNKTSYWKTRAITTGQPLPRHVDLPVFQTATTQRTNAGGDPQDLRVFKLLKAALELWQSKHDVSVEPRIKTDGNVIT